MQHARIPEAAGAGGFDLEACKDAVQPAFQEIMAKDAVSMGTAAGAELPNELEALVREAGRAGWPPEMAEEAIRDLAREHLGAQGASFD